MLIATVLPERTVQHTYVWWGVNVKAQNYQNIISEAVVTSLSTTLFANKNWIYQQDSAPSHKVKATQND